jgi:hypothetical protein
MAQEPTNKTPTGLKEAIRSTTRIAYSLQQKRIELANKITENFRRQQNLKNWNPSNPIYGQENDPGTMAKMLHDPASLQPPELTSYLELKTEEEDAFACLAEFLKKEPIFQEFFSKFPGLPPGVAGSLIGWLDPQKAPTPASFWKYCGLNPKKKGEAPKAPLKSLADLPEAEGAHNEFIKAKLLGELSPYLLALKDKHAEIYQSYKLKKSEEKGEVARSRSHLHNMSVRYMLKEFIKELHLAWRTLLGLPLPSEFQK